MTEIAKANWALAGVCLFLGTNYLATAVAVQSFTPAMLQGIRFGAGGLILLAAALSMGQRLPDSRTEWWRIAVVSFFSMFAGNWLVAMSVRDVPSGLAPVIISLMSGFFMLFCAAKGESPGRNVWIGLGAAFVGMVVMFWPDITDHAARRSERYYWSVAGLVGTAFVWAYGAYRARHYRVATPLMMFTALQYTMAGLMFAPVAVFSGEARTFHVPRTGWGAMAYLIVAGTWLAYGFFMYILPRLPAPRIATNSYIVPLVALVAGFAVRGERLTAHQFAGAAVIIASVVIVNFPNLLDRLAGRR